MIDRDIVVVTCDVLTYNERITERSYNMLTEQAKQLIREALAVDFNESSGDHKAWVEDVCDCPPHQDELTDYLHEAMAELRPL
jgi:hypothetical protein